ncbi:MAG: threonine synthase [Bacteroidota bacterium]|nr:threonine synthase [Bacteroidota bacterium]
MLFYNLRKPSERVDFRTATIQGLGTDKGLYFPEQIPEFPKEWIRNMDHLSDEEIAYAVVSPYVGNTIPEDVLKKIVAETIAFDIPLVPVSENISALELFHGPTLAFKDVGARFMSRCLGHFMKGNARPVTVLVATSGDTGGAVANGFYEVEGVRVVILYPSGKVSSVQELQLTTLGKNISALEVEGSFDDCQALVKQAFSDEELNSTIFLTSANSINVARWLPQQIYYLLAWKQWKNKDKPPVFSVPSGNFGNICAGLLAYHSGLPVTHFIAACNANAVVPDFLKSGEYKPVKAKTTLSNAMDVGDPSNFVRVLELFNHQFEPLKQTMSSESISDEETAAIIRSVYAEHSYLMDPHGAVGYLALKRYLKDHAGDSGIFLETAHPVKFYDVVEPIIEKSIPVPETVKILLNRNKTQVKIAADYDSLKHFLLVS